MHQLNVLFLGPKSFISTLDELKTFLKFNSFFKISDVNYDALIYHEDAIKDENISKFINNFDSIRIIISDQKPKNNKTDAFLKIPTTLREINHIVENHVAKKTFTENSSIRIKKYLLNKNEKKLNYKNDFIVLTEKEIQLLELFLNQKKPITKSKILSIIWKYSSDADTHTVETHIYRLRKKINDKFDDENLILNNKEGYFFEKKE